MSDVSRGEGWWLASDLKWYPPELADDSGSGKGSSIPAPIPELDTGLAGVEGESPPPAPTPKAPGRGTGQNSRRSRPRLLIGLTLAVILAGGGTALGLQASGQSRPGSITSQATGNARLPYSAATHGATSERRTSSPGVPGGRTRVGARAHTDVSAASTQTCCQVPKVVGEQFVEAEGTVYSAHLQPAEVYGAAADCSGVSVPGRAFIIGRQDPPVGSVLPRASTVTLYYCDGHNG